MRAAFGAGARESLEGVVREEGGRLVASLVRVLGDFHLAEEVAQDALGIAVERWPASGVPKRPDLWLLTVARRRAVDILRRDARYRSKLAELARIETGGPAPDNRLSLIFTCCHPALPREAQVALTLRAVCGLTVGEIARAFVASEGAVAQRLARARRKIRQAGIPYRVPPPETLEERLAGVLAVVYLLFSEGYLSSGGERPTRRDLAQEAEWLAGLLERLMPNEPEVLGLLALIRLHLARSAARFDRDGQLVLLQDQDRSLWDRAAISDASSVLVRAARLRRPGPYQLQAAIVACHAEAPSWGETDWPQILLLYDRLLDLAPSPTIRLHRAVAVRHVHGPGAAMAEVDTLAVDLARHHLFHAVRAELLRDLARNDEARAADRCALALTRNAAERALLQLRLNRDGTRTPNPA
jgi:RNA polymerase sigma-70 factor (ECF subfamily)